MLKITVPFKEKKEVLTLIEAGADELYCGYVAQEWTEKFTALEFERKGTGSNFTDFKELKESVDLAHQKNTPVYLTLNGLYVNAQYPLLLETIDRLEQIDFDAFIVADIGLLLTLQKKGTRKQIHISTGGTAFNSAAVDFYKQLGATRIILDRQVTLDSMKILSHHALDLDFEVFILNTLCVYIDGFCTFLHTYGGQDRENIYQKGWAKDEKLDFVQSYDTESVGDACSLKYSIQTFDPTLRKRVKNKMIQPTFFKQLISGVECGACALYDISRTNVGFLKIVGRQLRPEIRLSSTKFIRSALDILYENKNIRKEDFIERTQKLYQHTFGYQKKCTGNNCYHPEVLSRTRCHSSDPKGL